tara:strand:- start:12646 stop:13485 length:840 start_codon:yes stop_codon:yes gene_type:complete
MNRKEFTSLLIEWRKNFIHERAEPGLSKYIKSKFPIDIVFINRKITLKDYIDFLAKSGESLGDKAEVNTFYAGFEDMPVSLSFKKSESFKKFILEEDKNQKLFYNEANKNQFLNTTINKDMCLLLPSTWGQNITPQSGASNLNWQIHDLFHCFFHMSHGSSFYSDENPVFDDMEFEEKNDIVPYESETVGFVGRELLDWLVSINFTPETNTSDVTPSLFAWCVLKLPRQVEIAKEIIDYQDLSIKAKSALQQMHKISYNAMDILMRDFEGKFIYLSIAS